MGCTVGISVDLTSEIRWFFDGHMPPEVLSWFTGHGAEPGLAEQRCDSYRLDGQHDVGVKRRAGEKLELKLRLRHPDPPNDAAIPLGHAEQWRRWSPADGLVSIDAHTTWVDVDKAIIKRRFGTDGHGQPLTEQTRAMTGEGCDVEIAALSVNGRDAWTFAFAAFGPAEQQHRSLHTTWRALTGQDSPINRRPLMCGTSCGYPQWLSTVALMPESPRHEIVEPERSAARSIRFDTRRRTPADSTT